MAHEPFTDYERGVLGLRSKSGLPTAEYQLGSQGKLDPLTGQPKTGSNNNVDGWGWAVQGIALATYYVGLANFNFVKNRFRHKNQNKSDVLNAKNVSIASHIINTSAPVLSLIAGVSFGERIEPINGAVIGLSTLFTMNAGSVLLNSYSKKNVTGIKRPLVAFSISCGLALTGSGIVIGNDELQDVWKTRSTPYTHQVDVRGSLNIRSAPNTQSYIVKKLSDNECVRVTSVLNGWARVALKMPDGEYRDNFFVLDKFLRPKGDHHCPK